MKILEQAMIDRLKKLAARETIFDNDDAPIIDDYAGGNVDDAYNRGSEDGQIILARDILVALGLLGEN